MIHEVYFLQFIHEHTVIPHSSQNPLSLEVSQIPSSTRGDNCPRPSMLTIDGKLTQLRVSQCLRLFVIDGARAPH
jgi:hypothetical protein